MSQTYGSQQMAVSSATPVFPTNGRGGSQASVHPNFPATAQYLIEACTVLTSGAACTLTVFQGDGTTTLFTVAIPATPATGTYIPIGGLNGYQSTAGISAQISAGSTVTLWFRELFSNPNAAQGSTS